MSKQKIALSLRVAIQMFFFILVMPMLPLLISWRWDWWEAWAFAIIYIGGFVISRGLAARRHPDLLAERARFSEHEDTLPWDRILSPLGALGGGLMPLVAGLDALLGWSSSFGLSVKLLSLALILAGYALGTYAMMENRFFSGVVRIQTDRGHQVVSSGPYRWVRHPGYAGALITYLGVPFLLDSIWSLIPALFITGVLVLRTSLEDHTLQEQLEGYQDYTTRVRYRLLPGIW
jgi:protein-S-isoprenylcysteine O-methyltransferase Ste14